MPIGFHFDEIECAAYGLTRENFDDEFSELPPIGGLHGEQETNHDDSCIGGMHGEFREVKDDAAEKP